MTPHPQQELFLLVKPSEIAILMSYSKTIAEKGETLQTIDSRSHSNQKSDREKVLDVTLVKILEDFRMLSFNATSQHMEAISLYHAQEIVKQRLGEFVRGGQWG